MANQLSPGVLVTERDLTSVVPAVSTSTGATVIDAVWGPVAQVYTVDSQNSLVQTFGKPQSANATSWFTAANFLDYSTNLMVVRNDNVNQRNAVATKTGTITSIPVSSGGTGYVSTTTTVNIPAPTTVGGVQAVATAVISGGIIQSINITNPGTGYDTVPVVTIVGANTTPAVVGTVVTTPAGVKVNNLDHYSTTYSNGEGVVGQWAAKYPGALGNSLTVSMVDSASYPLWQYKSQFNSAPATSSFGDTVGITNDEMHIVVIDKDGRWTGTAGTVLEKFAYVSKASDAKAADGTSSYYKNVVNTSSKYIWWMDPPALQSTGLSIGSASFGTTGAYATPLTLSGIAELISCSTSAKTVTGSGTSFSASTLTYTDSTGTLVGVKIYNASGVFVGQVDPSVTITTTTLSFLANAAVGVTSAQFAIPTALTVALSGGVDDLASTDAAKMLSFGLFQNNEQYDISLVMAGKANATVANYVIQSVAEVRKDCVAFVSPENITTGAVAIGSDSTVADQLIAYRNLLTSSSYGFIDSGYKYQYDKYNDVYRWIPLNGDIAGICARTDYTNDAWWSPAGYNRGQLKNVVKLAYSPRQTDRDNLYKSGINPVVSFPGQGTILYGDKTLQAKPSAFDRINVRRLFIALEKAIGLAAKYQLFEFNDPYTRAQFIGLVSPFLRDVQGRRGITDFRVVCDESNNTSQIIDTNQFVGDVYIKPTRSINFLQLNFVATRSGVSFSEVAGATTA